MDLFHAQKDLIVPLAEKLRPASLEELLGQETFLKRQGPLIAQLKKGQLLSLILWGPPGCGKTSFARALMGQLVDVHLLEENAVDLGTKKIRELGEQSKYIKQSQQKKTLLFVDEIHRLNKGQQDVLLPYLERGDVYLVGATTENPSYELNSALLSRCRVIAFEGLSEKSLFDLLDRALNHYGWTREDTFKDGAAQALCRSFAGDGRQLINTIEELSLQREGAPELFPLSEEVLFDLIQSPLRYDKQRDEHYDNTSALIKSIRGSDPDGAVYYLARMIEGGEDPVFIARRLVVLASEDVGNGDPQALPLAVAGLQAVQLVGLPEARINLAQVVVYLSCAPKSNSSYLAIGRAQELVRQHGSLPIPKALRSSRTSLSKSMGYGKDYKYSHDGERGWAPQEFLPEKIRKEPIYTPVARGFEKRMMEYLKWLRGESES